jgi:acetyl esterase/lipase
LESVADARASVRWVQDHSAELGVDPEKIIVGGNSAGGHLALWTSIGKTPPGSDPAEAPKLKPVALILVSAPSDISSTTTATTPSRTKKIKERFGDNADALSPLQHFDAKMPPMLVFHGDADVTVPFAQSVNLAKALTDSGNLCKFVSIPGGTHSFVSETAGWRDKTRTLIKDFLVKQGIPTSD